MAKPFPPENAARLLETYDPVSIVVTVMEAAKTRGWVNGFAVMETEAGSTATIATNDGLSAAVQAAIRVSLADASSDRPREAIAFLRHLADWLTADAHGTHGALADDLARDIASVYQEAT